MVSSKSSSSASSTSGVVRIANSLPIFDGTSSSFALWKEKLFTSASGAGCGGALTTDASTLVYRIIDLPETFCSLGERLRMLRDIASQMGQAAALVKLNLSDSLVASVSNKKHVLSRINGTHVVSEMENLHNISSDATSSATAMESPIKLNRAPTAATASSGTEGSQQHQRFASPVVTSESSLTTSMRDMLFSMLPHPLDSSEWISARDILGYLEDRYGSRTRGIKSFNQLATEFAAERLLAHSNADAYLGRLAIIRQEANSVPGAKKQIDDDDEMLVILNGLPLDNVTWLKARQEILALETKLFREGKELCLDDVLHVVRSTQQLLDDMEKLTNTPKKTRSNKSTEEIPDDESKAVALLVERELNRRLGYTGKGTSSTNTTEKRFRPRNPNYVFYYDEAYKGTNSYGFSGNCHSCHAKGHFDGDCKLKKTSSHTTNSISTQSSAPASAHVATTTVAPSAPGTAPPVTVTTAEAHYAFAMVTELTFTSINRFDVLQTDDDTLTGSHSNVATSTPATNSPHCHALSASTSASITKSSVIIDTGASQHIFNDASWFVPGSIRSLTATDPSALIVGNSASVPITGVGSVLLNVYSSVSATRTHSVLLRDVLFSPSMGRNLVSVAQSTLRGLSFVFNADLCECLSTAVSPPTPVLFARRHSSGLYLLGAQVSTPQR